MLSEKQLNHIDILFMNIYKYNLIFVLSIVLVFVVCPKIVISTIRKYYKQEPSELKYYAMKRNMDISMKCVEKKLLDRFID